MSSASKSKSKDKKSGKSPSKVTSVHPNSTSTIPASGYNPVSGTFHTFDTAPVNSATYVHPSGRFKNIDDTDDSTAVEYDSVSNAESWSGGSEDLKEKPSQPTPRLDSIPGADNDKREKMRLKNERKHQRQKERRAQELHDRCSGYIMSRKLESLAQQLVAMGFSQERATMALILNEGRVEESVSCLIDAGEEGKLPERKVDGGGNLKIDISEELSRIAEMVVKYKATKQDVERTVVSCEGDLDKAEETLKAQKEEPISVPKPEESTIAVSQTQNPLRVKEMPTPTIMQHRRDEKDFNYTKTQAPSGSSVDPGAKSVQLLKKIPPPSKPEWPKPQQVALPADKRWPNAGSSHPVSFSLTSPMQVSPPPSKQEPRYVPIANELKNLQLRSVKEPVIVMQRPQSKQAPTTSLSSSPPIGWHPNSVEPLKPNGFVQAPAVSRSINSHTISSSNPMYNHHIPHQSQQQFMQQPGISNSMDSLGTIQVHNSGRGSTSPPLAAASSLGLFSRSCTNGGLPSASLSQVDWSTGSSMQFDYTNVDWSLDRGSLPSKPSGLWSSLNYPTVASNSAGAYGSWSYGTGLKSNVVRPVVGNGQGAGLQDGVVVGSGGDTVASGGGGGGSREWTSPFEEKDIFGLSRQFVSSQTL